MKLNNVIINGKTLDEYMAQEKAAGRAIRVKEGKQVHRFGESFLKDCDVTGEEGMILYVSEATLMKDGREITMHGRIVYSNGEWYENARKVI